VTDFVDANVGRGLADKIAFTDPQRTLSYGELQEATCRFGRGLQTLGLRQESRIVLFDEMATATRSPNSLGGQDVLGLVNLLPQLPPAGPDRGP
jgi:hypothetical protein